MKRIPNSLGPEILETQRLLDNLNADLASMPRVTIGTPYHLDRAATKQHLLTKLETLRGQARLRSFVS